MHAPQGAERIGRTAADLSAPRGPYAALDLGTNNCRLLVARPAADGFRVIDAFSRVVRLGEGLSQTGRLGEAAIERTLEALRICRDKMAARGVTRARLIATEACRAAENGEEFLERVRERVGLKLEIVDRETEATLAAAGCSELADRNAASIVLFDIGGGSSEIIWLDRAHDGAGPRRLQSWESLRLGVVSLAEKYGGDEVTSEVVRRDDQLRRRSAGAVRCAGRRPRAMRSLSSTRHVRNGDDDRRRPSQPAAL